MLHYNYPNQSMLFQFFRVKSQDLDAKVVVLIYKYLMYFQDNRLSTLLGFHFQLPVYTKQAFQFSLSQNYLIQYTFFST